MTIDEKRQRIKDNCINCMFCPLYEALEIGEHCFKGDADIETNYEIMFGRSEASEQPEKHIGDRQEHSGGGHESEEQ